MDFVNVNLLEPYFSAEEIKSMEQQAEKLLKQDELFASVTTLTCTDAIYETQNQIRFYFTLDDGSTLFASYKKEDNSFFFWTEKKEDSEQAIAEWFKQKELIQRLSIQVPGRNRRNFQSNGMKRQEIFR